MLQINSRHAIIIIIIIIIYCLLIILSYKKTNKQYKYSDLNNDQLTSSYFEKKILSRLPIIIWHNDFNIDLDNTLLLLTPGLLIKKSEFYKDIIEIKKDLVKYGYGQNTTKKIKKNKQKNKN